MQQSGTDASTIARCLFHDHDAAEIASKARLRSGIRTWPCYLAEGMNDRVP